MATFWLIVAIVSAIVTFVLVGTMWRSSVAVVTIAIPALVTIGTGFLAYAGFAPRGK
jgi:hypothetical protein